MTFSARQQNDAAEFLMLLMDHLEEKLKGTRQVDTGGGRGREGSNVWIVRRRGISGRACECLKGSEGRRGVIWAMHSTLF
jgi:hypothetical protein